ncbi:MAG: Cell division protein ftsA [Candidatus Magasanikbacteria bacterium GW2011_GWD2_43_18]|uniref:Cell division protein FtsA n=1 Tax=Candidatus Magasanikbacteria bacterium GW2011_GWE2_42_7 TaxID=1619052 RepID=A0A0G1BFM8_9BACT|nr:MAG: Cell division protein ftsA [Candidatus Magasanikbacteria bacterium GW2011_GWC2_42_27]KKS72004.1 MAG: Cell division protein ftsA [Candidatus Magasanikbacteria bacterium GW2011_GWE2_42_7]KKT04843.1 MAG: Cell division protein ftsA [Candidatus Magasanikbacteria bacterium GW2011_GWD2_43_18]KKT25215.1 MAG: Cell division protein ftsA [Candidatus Magasanikbacteria bacterium GW2011_GWA2_43_9]HBB37541.1 cell division protein FtsA [Candidatus Magasanikbacteria bacterium]
MVRGSSKQPQVITGIDIGSTAIRVAMGQVYPSSSRGERVQIIGAVEVPSEGIQKGNVVSIDETVSSLSHALEQIERLTGVPVGHAWIGISSAESQSQRNKGVVAVAKPDGEISDEDVDRVVEAARTIAPPLNYEMLHVLPSSFSVDGQTGIKDPVGMTGIRLEVDAQIIYTSAAHLKHITKAVYRTGIDIDDVVLSILASAQIVATEKQKELGVVVVNIGGPTTSLAVFEGGEVVHTATLPLGSEHVTNDVAIGLRTSIDVADRVKREFGHARAADVPRKDSIDLAALGQKESEIIKLHYIAEIIEARMSEIFEKIDAELRSVNRSQLLPAGIIFTGGGANVSGIVDLAKDELGLPAMIGYPLDVDSISDKVNSLAFSPAIGLVEWGAAMATNHVRKGPSRLQGAGKAIEKIQGFWKTLIP